MKISIRAKAHVGNDKYFILEAVTSADRIAALQLMGRKAAKEKQDGKEIYLKAVLEIPTRRRTFRQNNAVWKLITVIFQSMEGRTPTQAEAYSLYTDLLEEYAPKKPSRIKNVLRPVHISEATSEEGAQFIEGLIIHLAQYCQLSTDAQTDVVSVLYEWQQWRGEQETDPLDYRNGVMIDEAEWRTRHPYSDASGIGGVIERAHIVSRGASHKDIEAAWNWLALTPEEHRLQHQQGWGEFLRIYPHLKGRVERAHKKARDYDLET